MQNLNLISTASGWSAIYASRNNLSFHSFSDVVIGRENRDQPLDGGGNTLPNRYVTWGSMNVVMGMIGNN